MRCFIFKKWKTVKKTVKKTEKLIHSSRIVLFFSHLFFSGEATIDISKLADGNIHALVLELEKKKKNGTKTIGKLNVRAVFTATPSEMADTSTYNPQKTRSHTLNVPPPGSGDHTPTHSNTDVHMTPSTSVGSPPTRPRNATIGGVAVLPGLSPNSSVNTGGPTGGRASYNPAGMSNSNSTQKNPVIVSPGRDNNNTSPNHTRTGSHPESHSGSGSSTGSNGPILSSNQNSSNNNSHPPDRPARNNNNNNNNGNGGNNTKANINVAPAYPPPIPPGGNNNNNNNPTRPRQQPAAPVKIDTRIIRNHRIEEEYLIGETIGG